MLLVIRYSDGSDDQSLGDHYTVIMIIYFVFVLDCRELIGTFFVSSKLNSSYVFIQPHLKVN